MQGLRIDSRASRASTSPPSEMALPARSSSQTGMRGPPPSYESVVRSPNSSRLASPRGSRVSSPRASSRFQAYKSEEEEDGEEAGRKQAASRRPRRADSLEKQQSKVLSWHASPESSPLAMKLIIQAYHAYTSLLMSKMASNIFVTWQSSCYMPRCDDSRLTQI